MFVIFPIKYVGLLISQVCESVGVTNIETEEGMGGRKTIKAITTTKGRVKTEVVINCAGKKYSDTFPFLPVVISF